MSGTKNLPDSLIQAMQEQAFLKSQLSVTESDYSHAVSLLLAVANTDTSNASPAAQVLLSLYNGYEFHMDLVDLGYLDYENLQAALIAIRGRIFVSKEPHEVIANGAELFKALAEDWQCLHVKKRYKNHY